MQFLNTWRWRGDVRDVDVGIMLAVLREGDGDVFIGIGCIGKEGRRSGLLYAGWLGALFLRKGMIDSGDPERIQHQIDGERC